MPRKVTLAFLLLISLAGFSQESTIARRSSIPSEGKSVENADALIKQGQFSEAIQLLVNNHGQPIKGAQRELGIAYYRSGQLTEAEKSFRAAMAEDPGDSESIQMLGLTLYRLNKCSESVKTCVDFDVGQKTSTFSIDSALPMPMCWRRGLPPKLEPYPTVRYTVRCTPWSRKVTAIRAPKAPRLVRTPSNSRVIQ